MTNHDDEVLYLVRCEHSHEVVDGVFDLAEHPCVAQELEGKCQYTQETALKYFNVIDQY